MKASPIILVFIAVSVSACTSQSSTGFVSSFENFNEAQDWSYGNPGDNAELDANLFRVNSDAYSGSKSLLMDLTYLKTCLIDSSCVSYNHGWLKSRAITILPNRDYVFSVKVKPNIQSGSEAVNIYIYQYNSVGDELKGYLLQFNASNIVKLTDQFPSIDAVMIDLGNGWKEIKANFRSESTAKTARLYLTSDGESFEGSVLFDDISLGESP